MLILRIQGEVTFEIIIIYELKYFRVIIINKLRAQKQRGFFDDLLLNVMNKM